MRNSEKSVQSESGTVQSTIISFVAAASDSGKTTLIEKVIPILKASGLSVAVIKHASKGFDPEQPGKDSWRFREAGADAVAVVGPGGTKVMQRGESETACEDSIFGVCDIVLQEGFKSNAINKIEVYRHGVSGIRPLCMDDPSFIALVTDKKYDVAIPQFDLTDAVGVATFIGERE